MEIAYSEAAPLRLTPCLAWLVEYSDHKEVWLTSTDMKTEDVLHMLRNHSEGLSFTMQNITVGAMPVGELTEVHHQLYIADARKVDSAGMVQL